MRVVAVLALEDVEVDVIRYGHLSPPSIFVGLAGLASLAGGGILAPGIVVRERENPPTSLEDPVGMLKGAEMLASKTNQLPSCQLAARRYERRDFSGTQT
jgi:hypothetical protein